MVIETDVHLSVARNPSVPVQTAEVTVFANGTIIRAQERSESLYASIDLVASKLSRQLRRFKERNTDHHNITNNKDSLNPPKDFDLNNPPINDSLLEGKEVHLPSPGIRKKYFTMPPMTLEEAREQLDLIDHDFYLFREKKSGELQVIYKRNHGGYGVILDKNEK